MTTVCFVCKNPLAVVEPINNYTSYNCKQCSAYLIETIDPPQIENYLRHIVSGYIYENQDKRYRLHLTKDLINRIEKMPVLSVNEKIVKLMRWIESKTKYAGDIVKIDTRKLTENPELIAICYAINIEEVAFLLRSLFKNNLIAQDTGRGDEYIITFDGFNYLESQNKIIDSNLCFCAMSFLDEHNYIYDDFIEPAVSNAGYIIKRVDGEHHNEGITDRIIALIRKSKFVIADLTGNNHGVYFEAGFAKGLGREVILTCENKDFNNGNGVHFDIRHLNHLIWNKEELKKSKENLTLRIEAIIGRGTIDQKL